MASSVFEFESDLSDGQSPVSSPLQRAETPSAVFEAERAAILSFFKHTTCYEMIPQSGKLVVLDLGLTVKSALRAMRENNIVAAPLWDPAKRIYSGMLTVTDWIDLLLSVRAAPDTSGVTAADLGAMTLRDVRSLLAEQRAPHLICSAPEDACLSVVQRLIASKIHRMPVVCPAENTILSVLTHRLILRHLNAALLSTRDFDFMQMSIDELQIGTFSNLITCTAATQLVDALLTLSAKKLSTLPVVDEHGRIVDLYSKADVMALSRRSQPLEALRETVGQHLQELRSAPLPIPTCSRHDTFERIFLQLLGSRSHRVFCVDAEGRFEGVVSFLDIFVLILGQRAS